jgi:hypothetical protein
MVMTKMREGGCHCGAVRYRAEVPEPLAGGRCNCSICATKGVVMVRVPLAALEVTKGADEIKCYSFNTGVAKHWFCPHCGIHVFHQARSDPTQYGINAATLDGICPYADFPDVGVHDGVHHQKDNDGVVRSAGRLRFTPSE